MCRLQIRTSNGEEVRINIDRPYEIGVRFVAVKCCITSSLQWSLYNRARYISPLYGRTRTTTPSLAIRSPSLPSTTLISFLLSPSPSQTLILGSTNHPVPPTAIISKLTSPISPGCIGGIRADRLPCHTNDSAVSTCMNRPEAGMFECVFFRRSKRVNGVCNLTDVGGKTSAAMKLSCGGRVRGGSTMTVSVSSVEAKLLLLSAHCDT